MIIGYFPTYAILDSIISLKSYKTLNVYIDLKNVLNGLYLEHFVITLTENTLKAKFVDSSIFSSLVSYLVFFKKYAIKRNIKVNFYIFFETGQSYYHLNIDKKYKMNRKIDDLYGLDAEKRELFFSIIHKNLMLIEKALNACPNIKIIHLNHLEADFIPYYLIRNSIVDTSDSVSHLIMSNDHDMYQTLELSDNIYQFLKLAKSKMILKKGQFVTHFLKKESNIPDNVFPVLMALSGDPGDNVRNVKGVGPQGVAKFLNEFLDLTGGVEKLFENVVDRNPIFDKNLNINLISDKKLRLILEEELKTSFVSNNLRLVSFEIISREVDKPSTTEMIDRRKLINETIENSKVATKESLSKALTMNGVELEDGDLDLIFDTQTSTLSDYF